MKQKSLLPVRHALRTTARNQRNRDKSGKINIRILTRGGGAMGCVIMSATLGCMVILIAVQGTMVWGGYSQRAEEKSKGHPEFDSYKVLQGKQSLEEHRKRALEQLQQEPTSNICQQLPIGTTRTQALWTNFIASVLAASKHPDDPDFFHEEWTKHLLGELNPALLASTLSPSLSSLLSSQQRQYLQQHSKLIGRIIHILQSKMRSPETAPPLRIAVLGGSIAEGANCDISSVTIPAQSSMANPSFCAWPYRLEAFLNAMLGGHEWIKVTNMAETGTDTAFVTPFVKNWIYPPSLLPHGPDIVIHAYSRFDAANSSIPTLEIMSSFLQAVELSHPCGDPPLVIHMDDNYYSVSSSSTANAQESNTSSIPEGTLSIRYAGPVRKAIDADMHTRESSSTTSSNPNFSMAGHMSMAWIIAFNFMEIVLNHCAANAANSAAKITTPATPKNRISDNDTFTCGDASTGNATCPFAFFASPTMGTVNKLQQLTDYIQPFVVHNSGWQVLPDMSTGYNRKTGLVAIAPKAQVLFRFENISRDIRFFHLVTLKSNGEQWRGSKAQFRLAIKPSAQNTEKQEMETLFEIEGSHDSTTHITYPFSVDLGENKADIGSDVMLSVELIAGTNFKILGLMLCS